MLFLICLQNHISTSTKRIYPFPDSRADRGEQEDAFHAHPGVPDLHLVLRGILVHDDASLFGRHPNILVHSAVRPADVAVVQRSFVPERSDQQADGPDVPFAGHLPRSPSAVHRRITAADSPVGFFDQINLIPILLITKSVFCLQREELPREHVQDAVRRQGCLPYVLPVCVPQVFAASATATLLPDQGLCQGNVRPADRRKFRTSLSIIYLKTK